MTFQTEQGSLRLTFEEIEGLTGLLRAGVGPDAVVSQLASRDLVIRGADAWTVDPIVGTLLEPVVDPQWALRIAVIGPDEALVFTYCMREDLTTRVIEGDGARLLSALPTADLLVALRADLPLPANDPALVPGPEVPAGVLDEIAGLAVGGDVETAAGGLVAAGFPVADVDRYVAALAAPAHVVTIWNGTSGLAWAIDAERRVWVAPLSESSQDAVVRIGEASTVQVLLGAAALLPGGPGWAHIAMPMLALEQD